MKKFGVQNALVLAGLVSLLAVQLDDFANDPGLGWHLRSGQYLWEQRTFIRADFLLGGDPRPWIAEQWLGSLIIFLLYKSGSWPFAYAIFTSIFAAVYLGALYSGLRRLTGASLAATVAVLFAFKCGEIHFLLRPVLLNFPFFIIVYCWAHQLYQGFREAGSRPVSVRWLYVWVPALFAVWANIHPAFIFGLVLLLLVPISGVLDELVLDGTANLKNRRPELSRLMLLVVLSALATLLNPYGTELYSSIWDSRQIDFIMKLYSEWQSPDFKAFEGQLFEALLALLFLGVVLGRGAGWGCFDVLSILLFGHLAFQSVRFLPFFGIVASVPLVKSLEGIRRMECWQRFWISRRLLTAWENLDQRELRTIPVQALLSVCLLPLIIWAVVKGTMPFHDGELGPSSEKFPRAALDELLKRSEHDIVLANWLDWGGYIDWYSAPRIKPLIDDRTNLLGAEFYQRYFASFKSTGDYRAFMKEHGADYLLWPADSGFVQSLVDRGEFAIVYRDKLAVLLTTNGVAEGTVE